MSGLTVKQAARRSGYSETHIRRLINEEKIKGERFGERSLVVDQDSLDDYAARMGGLGTLKHDPTGAAQATA